MRGISIGLKYSVRAHAIYIIQIDTTTVNRSNFSLLIFLILILFAGDLFY